MAQGVDTYLFGSTFLTVGLSSVAAFEPPAHCLGVYVAHASGGTIACFTTGLSQLYSANLLQLGTRNIELTGPVRFFMAASGATSIVSVGIKFSGGISYPIAGS